MILIKDLLLIKKRMDMEFLIGPMEVSIWEDIKMILDKVLEKCIGLMEIYIKENGRLANRLDKVIL